MKLCVRCLVREIPSDAEACRSCRDEAEAFLRGGGPSRFTIAAAAELIREGIEVPGLLYATLRLRREKWRRSQEEEHEDFRREHGPALAAKRYLEARGELTAREAGRPWGVKPAAVRMRATRLRRNAARETATRTGAGDPAALP